MDKPDTDFPKRDFANSSVISAVYNSVAQFTLRVMANDKNAESEVDAIAVGIAAISGAIVAAAAIIGKRPGIDSNSPSDVESTLNPASALMTALLAVRAGKLSRENDQQFFNLVMNPGIYLSALQAAETILGHSADDMLNPGLVGAARRWEREVGPCLWEDTPTPDQWVKPGTLH